MLTIHRSVSLARLGDACADLLREPATVDPFAPELIVASGASHERWLRTHLARRLGVCAHVRVLSPSTLLEEVAGPVLGATRDAVRAWRPERLTWRVLHALTEHRDVPVFAPVRRWLDAGAAGEAAPGSARALAFAGRVAGWFAGYAVSSPALVRAWDAGAEAESWQAELWRAVRQASTDASGAPALHAVALGDALAAALADRSASGGAAGEHHLPARVLWLAQPGVGRAHVEVLATLAVAGVAVHALVPASGRPLRDGVAAHPLRRALGGRGAALEALIGEVVGTSGVACRTVDLDAGVDDGPGAPGVRAALRAAVMGGAGVGEAGMRATGIGALADGSVAVHACHGPMRQAEVLREALLARFEADASLRPRDVLVLTPDVAAYAPLLEAAFGGGPGVPEIPLRVVDRPARLANPVADVALRVFAIAAGRVDAAAVLDLLVAPIMAARWELGGGVEAQLHAWIEGAGARWGIDGADRAVARALPASEASAWNAHGWRFALDRLLLGWALPDDGGAGFGGTVPWDEIEGQDGETLGRLAAACQRLFAAVQALRVARPLAEWCAVVGAHVDALVWDADAEDREQPELVLARREFGRTLDALLDDARGGAQDLALVLEPAAMRALLEARLAEPGGGGGAPGAVTVATLGPGRVRPARVIALIGLDDGSFPRRRTADALDRRSGTEDAPDPGGEDRQVVLDALLAAESQLLVTYTGRSARLNEVLPPATPVALLIEAAAALGVDVTHEHPLAPFRPTTASIDRRMAPAFLTSAVPVLQDGVARTLTIDALVDALAQPARALVWRTLGVWLGAAGREVAIEDPLELDGLQHHGVRAAVLAALERGQQAGPGLYERVRAQGLLPHGALGRLAFEQACDEATRVQHAALPHRTGTCRGAVRIDQWIGDVRLTGTVGPCWEHGLVALHGGTARARHLLGTWVRHLALHAVEAYGPTTRSQLVAFGPPEKGTGRRTIAEHRFAAVPNATAVLTELVALADQAARTPVPLLPATADAYARAYARDDADPDDAHRRAMIAARREYDDEYSVSSEARDAYVARLHGATDPLDAEFARRALQVWLPLHASLGTARPRDERADA